MVLSMKARQNAFRGTDMVNIAMMGDIMMVIGSVTKGKEVGYSTRILGISMMVAGQMIENKDLVWDKFNLSNGILDNGIEDNLMVKGL